MELIFKMEMLVKSNPIVLTSSMPKDIVPMAMTLMEQPFTHKDWQFEIKWDGFRILSYLNGPLVELKSRNNKHFTARFDTITKELALLNLNAVFDGEVVVLKEDGCADFGKLLAGETDCLYYYVFDLLYYDGISLLNKPLIYRRELLEHILPINNIIRFSDHVEAEGEKLFELVKELNVEGIVAKHKQSTYQPGVRTKQWFKIKTYQTLDAVIAGFLYENNRFCSLIIGRKDKDTYRFIGLVDIGMTREEYKKIFAEANYRKDSIFPYTPNVNKRTAFKTPLDNPTIKWIDPIACKVKCLEVDNYGFLRHASFDCLG